MINIYLDKQPNMINSNDVFFNSCVLPIIKTDKHMEEIIKNSISKIEHVKFQGNDRIISRFNGYTLNITEISTGCKTVINALISTSFVYTDGKYKKVPYGKGNLVINIVECGANYIKYIYSIKNGNIYMPNYRFMDTLKNIKGEYNIYKDDIKIATFKDTDAMEGWYMTNE